MLNDWETAFLARDANEILDGEDLHSVTADELLAEIAGLAILAEERGHGVYSWWY